jgi:hypothetical protein
VRGTLSDGEREAPTSANVEVSAHGRTATCTIDGGSFSCPAVDPDSNRDTIVAAFPFTAFSREVDVDIASCSIEAPAQADFQLADWDCGDAEPAPAGLVYVRTRDVRTGALLNALADRVTVHSRNSEVVECILDEPSSTPGPRAYRCPTTTRFGSGSYTFEATRDGAVVTSEQIVSSRDCVADTAVIYLILELT